MDIPPPHMATQDTDPRGLGDAEIRASVGQASATQVYRYAFPGTPRLTGDQILSRLSNAPRRIIPDNWKKQFISSRGNEYFCEIDEEYLTDRFNLTGLNAEVPYYQYALDLITDVFDLDAEDHLRDQIEKSANHLYGLVHARYIVTTRGLAKMVSGCLFPFSVESRLTDLRLFRSRSTREVTLVNAPV